MQDAEKTVLDDAKGIPQNLEITTINQADLSEIKSLLAKQVEFLEVEKKEKLEKEQQLQKEQKQQEKELEELAVVEEQEKTEQTETVNSISSNIESTALSLEESNEQLVTLIQKIDEVIENQQAQKTASVEGAWVVTLALALSVGLKVFWDHVLKW